MSPLIRLLATLALCALAAYDIRHRRLPTRLVAVVAGLYIVDALVAGDPWLLIVKHGAVALAAFVIGFGLFALRWIGGGDVKLAAAIFMWTGAPLAWPVLLLVSALGLPVALCSMLAARIARRHDAGVARDNNRPRSTLRRLAGWCSAKRGVPYGVALAAGGAAGLWLPLIFRLPRF